MMSVLKSRTGKVPGSTRCTPSPGSPGGKVTLAPGANSGRVVAADFLQVISREGAVDDAAVVAGCALRFDEARVAGRGLSAIDDLVLGVLGLATGQHLPLRAAVCIRLSIG